MTKSLKLCWLLMKWYLHRTITNAKRWLARDVRHSRVELREKEQRDGHQQSTQGVVDGACKWHETLRRTAKAAHALQRNAQGCGHPGRARTRRLTRSAAATARRRGNRVNTSRKQLKHMKKPSDMQRSSANGTCQNLLTRRVVLTHVAAALGGSRADISLRR